MFMSEKYCKGNQCGECCGGVCFESDGSISLSDGELEILMEFAQFSFLPVASDDRNDYPVYRESNIRSEYEYALILSGLQKKGMIHIDYNIPLLNYEYRCYSDCKNHGSMALTLLGQKVIDLI